MTSMSEPGETCQLRRKNPKDLLEKQDCVSCRIFGSTACLGMAAYTAYWAVRQQTQYRGYTRIAYLATCATLASGNMLLLSAAIVTANWQLQRTIWSFK